MAFAKITAYCSKLNYLSKLYGEDAVLATLPLCMKGVASEWLDGLEPEVIEYNGIGIK
jgi:hypothetical protein